MNSENELGSQRVADDEAAPVSGDGSFKGMPKELKELVSKTVDRLKEEAYRNGRKARAHKDQMKADYAEMILKTEGRDIRDYRHYATEDERKAARRKQKAISKANRSPAQIDREREADRLRKQGKADGLKEAAQQKLQHAANYGKF